VLGPVPGVIGALLGAEAARLAKGESPAFVGRLVQYDSRSMSVRTVRYNPNPLCAVCGPEARIRALSAADYPATIECATP
jgi:molybdopterin-synthase adenylyltransferase